MKREVTSVIMLPSIRGSSVRHKSAQSTYHAAGSSGEAAGKRSAGADAERRFTLYLGHPRKGA